MLAIQVLGTEFEVGDGSLLSEHHYNDQIPENQIQLGRR